MQAPGPNVALIQLLILAQYMCVCVLFAMDGIVWSFCVSLGLLFLVTSF